MVLTKTQAEANLKSSRSELSSKRSQIASARKDANFRGVTIQDQFNLGRLGIETFREKGRSRRRTSLKEIAGFQLEIPILQQDVILKKQQLDFFSMEVL